ncbi:MAG: hypothetical protein FWE33_04600 [Defluviitaleaceae bacterium]|nr:hypothetical protein [Defluviitaleaceae bacterium]
MAIKTLAPHQRLVQCGQTALRAPDGTPLPAVPMYIIVGDDVVCEKTGLAESEIDLHRDIAAELAALFGQYVEGVEALERSVT